MKSWGPGVAYECGCKNGSHIAEDHFYPEIIHPETGEVLPLGQEGELVLTTLTKTGMPLLRYRTKDLTTLMPGTCECGRTSVRFTRILGRSDDMLIIRGINRVPLTGGKRDSGDAGICAPLHVGGRPQKQHGYVGGAGRVASG